MYTGYTVMEKGRDGGSRVAGEDSPGAARAGVTGVDGDRGFVGDTGGGGVVSYS